MKDVMDEDIEEVKNKLSWRGVLVPIVTRFGDEVNVGKR
jgi:hypothetical protein